MRYMLRSMAIGVFPILLLLAACAKGGAGASATSPAMDFVSAVQQVNHSSIRVHVSNYATGKSLVLVNTDVRFKELVGYLNKSTVKQVTTKTQVIGTTTILVTVPCAIGYILDFQSADGSSLRFSLGSERIWFETDAAISEATIGAGLTGFLQRLD